MRKSCRRVNNLNLLRLACLLVCAFAAAPVNAETSTPKIVCRASLSEERRTELSAHLRSITGWTGLHFDGEGVLHFGAEQPSGGSASARALLAAAREGESLLIFEDASGNPDVAFSRVVEGRWKGGSEGRPPAYVVQIDFTDFGHVMGDGAARAAFNSGWVALHEIEHAVNDSADADGPGEPGECEEAINRMRRECGLAERAEYFYKPLPGQHRSDFKARFMRLAFEHSQGASKPRRYWLMWDSDLVGGLPVANQLAGR
jgi:hypothetical protein